MTSLVKDLNYKYNEKEIFQEIINHINGTYNEHYQAEDQIQCFDAWIALGDSGKTFRNCILKYLWRYGKKDGLNRKDVLKSIHYLMMILHVDFYKNENDKKSPGTYGGNGSGGSGGVGGSPNLKGTRHYKGEKMVGPLSVPVFEPTDFDKWTQTRK